MKSPGPPAPPAGEVPFRRLDSRTLVVTPVQRIVPLLPIPVAIYVFGRDVSVGPIVATVGVVLLIVGGNAITWWRFGYRVSDDRLEIRSGLIEVRRRVVPLDRIRGVDVEAKLTHRMLGVAVVRVDSGGGERGDDAVKIDAVSSADAEGLRRVLLRAGPPAQEVPGTESVPDRQPVPPATLLTVPPRWLLYAPLFGTLVVAVPGAIAAGYGAARQLGVIGDPVEQTIADVVRGREDLWAYAWLVPVALVALPLCALLIAVLWYGRWVVLDAGSELRVERGLATHRTVSLERRRLRGVVLSEPLLGRRLGAARLSALLSGLDGADRSVLAPLGPRDRLEEFAEGLADDVVGPLHRHPRAALRRRLWPALVPGTAVVVVGLWLRLPLLLVVGVLLLAAGVALAVDLYRNLGHALRGHTLAVRSGSFVRRTEVVSATDPIGMRVRQGLMQRRAGLATVQVALVAGQDTRIDDMAAAEVAPLAAALFPER